MQRSLGCAVACIARAKTLFNRRLTKRVNIFNHLNELQLISRCRVAIVGLGGVGKSLAHLLKMFPGELTELRLCNRSNPEGLVEELSQIPTRLTIYGFEGMDNLSHGLKDVDIVVVAAGVSRHSDLPREQLFQKNAMLCVHICSMCAKSCPEAFITILSNPLNLLVPVAAGVLKKYGVYHPGRLFGICKIDQMRAQHYYAEAIGAEPKKTYVPVVGGHSLETIVPLFSKGRPNVSLTDEETVKLIQTVRTAGQKIIKATQGYRGSTYTMASAALYLIHKLCRALHHEPHIIASGYVDSTVTAAPFFSNELLLGPRGIERNLGYGNVSEIEQMLIDEAIVNLQKQIVMAEDFVDKNVKVSKK